jgi:hypothetical protein
MPSRPATPRLEGSTVAAGPGPKEEKAQKQPQAHVELSSGGEDSLPDREAALMRLLAGAAAQQSTSASGAKRKRASLTDAQKAARKAALTPEQLELNARRALQRREARARRRQAQQAQEGPDPGESAIRADALLTPLKPAAKPRKQSTSGKSKAKQAAPPPPAAPPLDDPTAQEMLHARLTMQQRHRAALQIRTFDGDVAPLLFKTNTEQDNRLYQDLLFYCTHKFTADSQFAQVLAPHMRDARRWRAAQVSWAHAHLTHTHEDEDRSRFKDKTPLVVQLRYAYDATSTRAGDLLMHADLMFLLTGRRHTRQSLCTRLGVADHPRVWLRAHFHVLLSYWRACRGVD